MEIQRILLPRTELPPAQLQGSCSVIVYPDCSALCLFSRWEAAVSEGKKGDRLVLMVGKYGASDALGSHPAWAPARCQTSANPTAFVSLESQHFFMGVPVKTWINISMCCEILLKCLWFLQCYDVSHWCRWIVLNSLDGCKWISYKADRSLRTCNYLVQDYLSWAETFLLKHVRKEDKNEIRMARQQGLWNKAAIADLSITAVVS